VVLLRVVSTSVHGAQEVLVHDSDGLAIFVLVESLELAGLLSQEWLRVRENAAVCILEGSNFFGAHSDWLGVAVDSLCFREVIGLIDDFRVFMELFGDQLGIVAVLGVVGDIIARASLSQVGHHGVRLAIPSSLISDDASVHDVCFLVSVGRACDP
jgi:hypothetical protein